METKIAQLIFRYGSPDLRVPLASIPRLTAAMVETNGPFIEAKIPIRAHVISIYSDADVSEPPVSCDGIFPSGRNVTWKDSP